MAAEQRKAGQAALESVRAAEAARDLQSRLAAHVRAAVAAGVPRAAEVWEQLAAAMGAGGSLPVAAEAPAPALSLPPSPMLPLASPPRRPSSGGLQPACPPPAAAGGGVDDSTRYRSLLADLETSIDRWWGELRVGEPLTLGGSLGGSLGGASFFLPAPAAGFAFAAASPTSSPTQRRQQGQQRRGQAAEQEAALQTEGSSGGEEEALDVEPRRRSRSPSRWWVG